MELPGPVVSADWLFNHLKNPQLVVLEASFQLTADKNERQNETDLHIPGAQLFNINKICDLTSKLPHMMANAAHFGEEVRALGVCQDSVIVVYDRVGIYSSPRIWWMFKAMGHDQIAVLDGGLPSWIKSGYPQTDISTPPPGNFVASERPELFCNADEVAKALVDENRAVLDARSQGRFLGNEPEPRPGLRGGHMPGALNLPFETLITDGHLRPIEELKNSFANFSEKEELILSCGSGVTACVLALAAELVGHKNITVYDGSWSEWGSAESLKPVVNK